MATTILDDRAPRRNSGQAKASSADGAAREPDARTDLAYAGFWRRFGAYLIDLFVLGLVAAILRALTGLPDIGVVDFATMTEQAAPTLWSVVVGWLYFAGCESSARQATPGKAALGMVVTDLGGNRISFLRASGRYAAKFVSAIVLMIGFVMAAVTARKQALHDQLAGTVVVRIQA